MPISASGLRRVLVLSALGPVAALAAACGTSSGSSSPAADSTVTVTATPSSGVSTQASQPPAARLAECTTAMLRVKVGSSNGAAGTIYHDIVFTNVGSGTCFLQGYPGVSLVSTESTAGSQIGADAKREPGTAAKQVVLTAGQTAHAVLGVAEAGNFPASKCNAVTAHWLKVFPPDQTVAAYAPFTTQTCASTSVPTMLITTISSGA